MEGLLIATNLLLNTPLTAGVTFEISKNPITVKGSGYPHITEIHVVAWTILVPENLGMENVRETGMHTPLCTYLFAIMS